jgi:signal transduction histidine kinase
MAIRRSALRFAAALITVASVQAFAAVETTRVLVLYSNGRLMPGNVEGDRGLNQTLRAPAGREIALFSEFLDSPRFGGPDHERVVTTYLRGKYATAPPCVLVAVGEQALDFLLRHRAEVVLRVPVVHVGVDRNRLSSLAPLPPDVVGVPVDYSFGPTIGLALRLHPHAQRLVIVTGAAEPDRAFASQLRDDLAVLSSRVDVEVLSGLPTREVLRRLRALGSDAVVVTPGYFQDGDGQSFAPFSSVEAMALASSAPVYGPFSTFIGTGIVGGSMPSFEEMGRQTGRIVSELLAGAEPGSLRLPKVVSQTLNVDWRQVRRWGVDTAAIPADAIIHYKPPTLIEAHRNEVIAAVIVFVLQGALIVLLFAERRRRRSAELAEEAQRTELAHASRLAIAGELTGSLAHEISQPLGAILSNADAAELILASGGDRREELRSILADIRRDDVRASEVIRRLRTLLSRHEVERRAFDLGDVVRDAEGILGGEARRRRVALYFRPPSARLAMVGDPVQMQQVLINLVLNAMDAVAELPEDRRSVVVSVECGGEAATILVQDTGSGVPPHHLPKLFEPFFTTKPGGMGLGLSIVHTLVEAHGGTVTAASAPGSGAIFRIELPLMDPTETSRRSPHEHKSADPRG